MNSPRRIMIVDDDFAVSTVLSRLLERDGFAVTSCASGEEALEHMDPIPDVVVLDLCMPGWDGVETMRRIRLLHQSMPIIIATGLQDKMQGRDVLAAGATDYISKPIDFKRFLKTVAHHASLRG